ncbi:MAG: MFS transporter [Rickettsiales bacterium]|nr:MFS transporter [Rickettsiales bacterium]
MISSKVLSDRLGHSTYRGLLISVVLMAFFCMVFASTMVNVAIPNVMGTFGVGQDKAQFLSSAFLATTVASLLANTWLIARFGQPAIFSMCLIVFIIGSFVSSFAPTLDMIIFGRVIQGFGAGVIQPLIMVLLFDIFPREKRGIAMGFFSMGVGFALGLAPALGGIVVDTLGWRYVFLIPVPVALLSLALGVFFIPERKDQRPAGRFDFIGYGLICSFVFCLMTILGNGQRWGWVSDDIVFITLVMILSFAGFIYSQLRPGGNLIDLSVFRNFRFCTVICISFFYGMGSFAQNYAFPIFSQIVQGYTPTLAGSLLLPGAIVAALILPLTGRLADRFPTHNIIFVGQFIFIVSAFALADADVNTVFWVIAFYLLVGRLGIALTSPCVNSAALAALPPDKVSTGAGIVNLFLMLGGSFGISALVVVLERRVQLHGEALTATQNAANEATRALIGEVHRVLGTEGIPDAAHNSLAYKYLGDVVEAQANTLSFQDGFIWVAIAAVISLIPATILMLQKLRP